MQRARAAETPDRERSGATALDESAARAHPYALPFGFFYEDDLGLARHIETWRAALFRELEICSATPLWTWRLLRRLLWQVRIFMGRVLRRKKRRGNADAR